MVIHHNRFRHCLYNQKQRSSIECPFEREGAEEVMADAPPLTRSSASPLTILRKLVNKYGWEGLAKRIDVKCFKSDPSINSSLKFLRKTPWARKQVEDLFVASKFWTRD